MKKLKRYSYIVIVFVFIVILYMSYNSYNRSKNIIKSKYETESHLVENSVVGVINNARDAYSISETVIDEEMKNFSKNLIEKYSKNPYIESWNLSEIKKEMEYYDVYTINDKFKIVNTTLNDDLDMDFSKWPAFSRLLKNRIQGNNFTTDKMDISSNTGEIKKYSYMPTPDHKYIIELSISITDRYPVLKKMNIFSLARNLADKYKCVENISFYKFNEKVDNVGTIQDKKNPINVNIPKKDKDIIKEAVLSNTVKNKKIKKLKITKYIPVLIDKSESKSSWWNSIVIGITYSDREMLNEIKKETNSFFISIATIAIVFMVFMLSIIYLLKKMEYMAYHDYLTGLENRKAFEEHFNKNINKKIFQFALLYIDLDNFKYVNDNYGHDIGDKLLIEVGKRLKSTIKKDDKVSRIGGDEFVILLNNIKCKNDAYLAVKRLKNSIKKPCNLEGKIIDINCSIGLSISSDKKLSLEELIKKADMSMYHVKRKK